MYEPSRFYADHPERDRLLAALDDDDAETIRELTAEMEVSEVFEGQRLQ